MEFDLGEIVGSDIQGHVAANFFQKSLMSEIEGEKGIREIVINLSGVSYVDSMTLGALVSFRSDMKKRGKEVILKNPRGGVRKKIQIIRFDKLFKIT